MKKIALLINPLNFKTEQLEFAAYFGRLGRSNVTGVFIEPQHYGDANASLSPIVGQIYDESLVKTAAERREDTAICNQNMERFKEACISREVGAVVHHFQGNVLRNAVHETRYSDLFILDPSLSFTHHTEVPSRFAIELLNHAECPVLIAPSTFAPIEEVVIAYDGSHSSVFAIKQFYYQLPELADKKVTVLQILEKDDHLGHSDEQNEFREWMSGHFQHVHYQEIRGNAGDTLPKYFVSNNENRNKLLVTGAFGRNLLSTFFKPSTANLLLKTVDVPIFIAHH